jgi:D-xylose transport system permease protein
MSVPTATAQTGEQTPVPPQAQSIPDAVRDWWDRIRGGDVGSMPAILGLVVLIVVFSILRPHTFTNSFNFANLINQSAGVIVIAMGLVFVLLLGEIDLSAGYAAGTAAVVMGVVATDHDQPWWLAILAALATGAVIGLCIGLLVARLGIPSFVVTLAAFLGLQGVVLQILGDGGDIAIRNPVLLALNNNTMPVWLGWTMCVAVVAGYALVMLRRIQRRRASGLTSVSMSVWAAKVIVLAIALGLPTYYLSQERSRNPAISSIKGVPIVVAIILVLLLVLTFLLVRTPFGRHVYATGGNAEAARRAGIDIKLIRLLCFVICSTMAAVAGILIASRDNGATAQTGGSQTLLYAVGAAVIGGTSLFGGKGRVVDAIIGGLVIAVIANGMGLLQQTQAVVYIVTALVLLLAASVDAITRRRSASSGRV